LTASAPEGRPERREDVIFRSLADEWVAYDPATGMLHVLNLTAALVWSHCDGEHDAGAIVAAVRAAFEPPPDEVRVRRDVGEALGTFARKGLLR
jgi:hypothetical protein